MEKLSVAAPCPAPWAAPAGVRALHFFVNQRARTSPPAWHATCLAHTAQDPARLYPGSNQKGFVMLNRSFFVATALLASISTGAAAKTYNIAISGSCDTLTLTVTSDIVVGTSNAPNGCDDSYEVGTTAKVSGSVSPGGSVLVAAGDLGTAPDQWVWEFNLKTGQAELRGTLDGATEIQAAFSFTVTKGKAEARPNLPKATEIFAKIAKPITH
jgi:hypothetical protein